MNWDWLLDRFEEVWVLRSEIDGCKQTIVRYAQDELRTEQKILALEHQVEIERTRRIAAETVAAERKFELDRLHALLGESRQELQSFLRERLSSLDALNVKLMSPSVRETPDIASLKAKGDLPPQADLKASFQKFREQQYRVDLAVVSQLRNRNRLGVTAQKGVRADSSGDPLSTGTLSEGGPLSDGTAFGADSTVAEGPGAA